MSLQVLELLSLTTSKTNSVSVQKMLYKMIVLIHTDSLVVDPESIVRAAAIGHKLKDE